MTLWRTISPWMAGGNPAVSVYSGGTQSLRRVNSVVLTGGIAEFFASPECSAVVLQSAVHRRLSAPGITPRAEQPVSDNFALGNQTAARP